MASRGFEFAFNLDGSNLTPKVQDWAMASDADGYVKGDALTIDSSGYMDKAGTDTTEVAGICQETDSGSVTAAAELKVAVVTRNQVWKCSMDASSTSFVNGYTKDIQFTDENTIDADGSGSGGMILFDTSTDDEDNILAYVVFADTTFGNT